MSDGENRLLRAVSSRFVTFPGEEIVLVQRKHWIVFMFPAIFIFIAGIVSTLTLVIVSSIFPAYAILCLTLLAAIFAFLSSFLTKSIVDWYFNFYIVTNKKIVEVCYKPSSSREISEVLLDQVKCTEIDTRIGGLMNEFLDVGDVMVTFDRPTHQEEFIFTTVPDPKEIERRLENAFYTKTAVLATQPSETNESTAQRSWYNKEKNNPSRWRYTEEIIPSGRTESVN